MTALPRPWLPQTVFDDPRMVDALTDPVREWSLKWFGAAETVKFERCAESHDLSGPRGLSGWRPCAAGIWLAWDDRIALRLARQALALGHTRPKTTAEDERLLLRYAERMAGELAEAMQHRFGPAETDAETAIGMKFALQGSDGAFRLLVAHGALVALRKQLCPAWIPRTPAATRLSILLAGVPIEIEASFGAASLSALDLRQLAIGDVIVLERTPDEPLALTARESGTLVGAAQLVPTADGLALIAS